MLWAWPNRVVDTMISSAFERRRAHRHPVQQIGMISAQSGGDRATVSLWIGLMMACDFAPRRILRLLISFSCASRRQKQDTTWFGAKVRSWALGSSVERAEVLDVALCEQATCHVGCARVATLSTAANHVLGRFS